MSLSEQLPSRSVHARQARHGARSGALRLTPLAAALAAYLVAGSVAAPAQAAAPVGGAWFASQGRGQVQAARQAGMKHGPMGTNSVSRQHQLTQQSLQRSMANVHRTAVAIAAHQAAQRAAREQARGGASDIPDGLGQGGLETDLAAGWLNAQEPSQSQQGGRTEVSIKQTAKKAILNWKTFNVGRGTTVHFDQSAGNDTKNGNTWAALNRINDPSDRPSRIAGQIKAEGAVYLINRNGVVFHGSSQVNTRTLIASSLKLSDDQFMAGINKPSYFELNGNNLAIPQFGEFPDRNNFVDGEIFEPGPIPGDVRVEAGAEITAHTGGKIMLFGPKVANAGRISAPDGQVILAAGENVFLKSPNPEDIDAVRGLDVAVAAPAPRAFNYWHLTSAFFRGGNEHDKIIMERDVLPAMRARAAEAGYEASNTGVVSADRGNITMQALDVRQDGALLASTALDNRNGSIVLRAWGQGTHAHSSDINRLANWDSGSLTLGSHSVTQVIPDAGDTSEIELAALATRYEPGRIVLYGKVVDLQGGSNIWAPAGNIDIQSAAIAFYIQEGTSRKPGGGSLPDGNRIYIDSDAFLGVGGLQDVSVPTGRNFIEAEFRINELRDSPLLRDSWLRGQKVVIDRRISDTFGEGPMGGVEWVRDADGKPVPGAWVGTPLGDMTGWVGVGKTDLQELSTIGGTISLVTQNGDVVTRPGSLIDISGGSVRYTGGLNTATLLQGADGRYYDIGQASPGMAYVGVAGEYVRQHARWGVSDTWRNPVVVRPRYEPGYTEGRGAGAIEIKAGRAIVLEGDLWGGAVTGDRQTDGAPQPGGSLVVGGGAFSDTTWSPGRLIIGANPVFLPDGFTADSPIDEAWYKTLAPEETGTGESGRIKQTWVSDAMLSGSGLGDIMMFMTDDGRIDASASVELSPGASLRLLPVENAVIDFVVEGTVRAPGGTINIGGERIELAAGSRLDAAGQWVNTWQDGPRARPLARDGGSVRIIGQIAAQGGSVIDVSGGARLVRQGGKPRLYVGDAGDIGLVGVDANSGLAEIDLRGYAAGSSGALEIVATTDTQIGGVSEDGTVLVVPETLFGEKGFGSVTVSAPGRSMVVPAGVQAGLSTRVVSLADGRYVDMATGAHITDLGMVGVPRLDESLARAPGALLLGASRIEIGAGAVLRTGPAGQLSLNGQAEGQIDVRGTLDAPAGVISLE
ncbi:MAG TPA: filamentous hemagglutinin N-terminal domain-containing protein, partial [Bordetella sp.]|nr:filamentous hemagglutinin N-terminal domain-containing protein [Bordetella sp.]